MNPDYKPNWPIERTYNIQLYSPVAFIATFVTVMLSSIICVSYISIGSSVLTTILDMSGFAIGLFVAGLLSTARIKLKLDDSGFHHKWIKQFFFSGDSDVKLIWGEIIDYTFEEDRTFHRFQLTLNNKMRYRFYRQSIWAVRDDFHKFKRDFPQWIREINSASENEIKLGKTIYEEKWFRWVMAVSTVVVLLLLLNGLINGSKSANSWTLGALAFALLFYWVQVWEQRAQKPDH